MAEDLDMRGKSKDELHQGLAELKKEHFNLRFQQATGQLENTSRVRKVRRQIARIKTHLQVIDKAAPAGAPTE